MTITPPLNCLKGTLASNLASGTGKISCAPEGFDEAGETI
jgi:hypothetical protein